jgi:hypothetical protein
LKTDPSIGTSKTKPKAYRKNAASAAGISGPKYFTKEVTPTNISPVTIIHKMPRKVDEEERSVMALLKS